MATGGYHVDTSDEIFDFTCSPCAGQNRNREAVRYCVECQDYYCQSCTDMHKMFPAMRGHKLLNKTDFSSSGQQSNLPPVPTERCYIHKTKLIDMYCGDHDEVCCTSCVAENHRSCDSVTSITDVIKKREAKEAKADSLKEDLNTLINVCLEIKTTKEKDMSEIDKTKDEALDEIVKQRKELDTLLNQLEDASRKKVENEHKTLLDESAKVKQRVAEFESSLQKRVAALQLSGDNEAQRFVSEKLGHKDLVAISEVTNTILRQNTASFEYRGDPKLREVLSQMKVLGEIRRHELKCPCPRKILYKVKRKQTLNVKHPNDKGKCDILSCCCDDRGNLLLTDIGNTSLKRVNIQTQTVTDHCMMPDSPIAVCCVNKEEAAVSLRNRSIQFVSIRDQMKITRQVKLKHKCWGLACNEEKMYVTDRGKKFYIYDIFGKLIRIIEQDNVGNDIFSNNTHVTFDSYSKKVYIADIYKGLVSFTEQGEYISSITDKMLDSPVGVCFDGRGNVFVGGWDSRNVIQIGADGQMLGEVVGKTLGLGIIWSVGFDENHKRLVVTTLDCDKIYIFDLE